MNCPRLDRCVRKVTKKFFNLTCAHREHGSRSYTACGTYMESLEHKTPKEWMEVRG